MSSLIFKVIFCNESCFNVVFCFVTGWLISWIWRWWCGGQLATSLQAQFVTFIDCVLSFLSFKLYFINGREFCLLSLKHNAQLRYFENRPSCEFCFITSCSLLSPAQILEETHPSVHGSPFLAHDPDTVGTFSVPPDPAGKVSTFLLFDWLFWRVRSTNTTFYTSSDFIHDWWTHQERECYWWDSNFYSFVSTAGLVLAGVLTAVHGSSHGQTSFSGYLPPHVNSQHYSSPDVHTDHHNTPSTIFTPGRSWRYPYFRGSGLSTVTQGESHLESSLFVNEVMDRDSGSLS